MKKKSREFRLLPPRQALLSAEQEREAVTLLAELLLDAVAKRWGVRSGGVIGGACGGACGGVFRFPERHGKSREAA